MPSNSERKLLLLLDGHAMVFRAWFSIPERLSTATGVDTRGAYGFLNTFLRIVRERRPTHVAVAFDTAAPTFRDEMFPAYKAQRPPVPDELHAQVPMVKKILSAFKVPVFEKDGYEADDVVGTIARLCEEQGVDVLIVTGDADQLQLVSSATRLLMYTGFGDTRVYDVEGVKNKYGGLGPEKVPDIKAITGDPSDNIKGVPGLGEKTAIAVLTHLGTIENTLANLDEVEKIPGLRGAKRARSLLEQFKQAALDGKKLTTIVRDAPIGFNLDDARFWRYDRNEVVQTLLGLEFRSVIAHVPEPALGKGGPAAGPTVHPEPVEGGEPQGPGGSRLPSGQGAPVTGAGASSRREPFPLEQSMSVPKPSPSGAPWAREGQGVGQNAGEGHRQMSLTNGIQPSPTAISPALPPSDAAEQLTMAGEVVAPPAFAPSTQDWRKDTDYQTVTARDALADLIKEISAPGGFAFDTETTSTDPMRAALVGVSFSTASGRAWYVPVGHRQPAAPALREPPSTGSGRRQGPPPPSVASRPAGTPAPTERGPTAITPPSEGEGQGVGTPILSPAQTGPGDARSPSQGEGEGGDQINQLPRDAVLAALRPVFEDPAIPKTAHNANYDLTVLAEHGIEVRGVAFDSMIAAALVGRRAIGLKDLALDMFHAEMTPITELIGTGRKQITMDRVPVEQAAPYASADADFAWRVQDRLRSEIDRENQGELLFGIEIPLLPVIVGMQRAGVLVDRSVLSEMSEQLASDIAAIAKEASGALGGRALNLNANQQIAAILFDELGVPRTRRTKTGYTMDAAALEGLLEREDLDNRAYHLIKAILKYRELAKIKSTYVDTLPDLIHPRTGRVHTSFNQVGSATGRLSSNDPNVQNIPVRTELGRRVRKAFVADHANGWVLLGADYSQIELRILAHMSQEPHLLAAFKNGEDIHSATAQAMYGVEKVTPDQRRIAKILNFGVIYGLGAHGVAMQTDLTRQQGQQFIDMYFGKYPGVRDYIDRVKAGARQRGYVETVTGRRRRLPDLRSPNQGARAAAERMAINMPIQGTAADVIKIAMVQIDAEITRRKLRSRMLIQVHDELIFEVAPGELDEVRALATTMMPGAMSLTVPLNVETKHGKTWGDME